MNMTTEGRELADILASPTTQHQYTVLRMPPCLLPNMAAREVSILATTLGADITITGSTSK